MRCLLVIEDGTEYAEFARLFLRPEFTVIVARSAAEAVRAADAEPACALLIDLRFDRAPQDVLIGDLDATAERLFAGDRARALRQLQDQQGVLILAELRKRGHRQPAVFVHDFPTRRLENLRRLYGDVRAVPNFDAQALRLALEGGG
jgi:ActR/RegA family two-component response regulator